MRAERDPKSATEPLNQDSTRRAITELREQTIMVVDFLEKAFEAAKRGDSGKFAELFASGLEAAKSARERARAIDETVAPRKHRSNGARTA